MHEQIAAGHDGPVGVGAVSQTSDPMRSASSGACVVGCAGAGGSADCDGVVLSNALGAYEFAPLRLTANAVVPHQQSSSDLSG